VEADPSADVQYRQHVDIGAELSEDAGAAVDPPDPSVKMASQTAVTPVSVPRLVSKPSKMNGAVWAGSSGVPMAGVRS
jgi:hypothetical protein